MKPLRPGATHIITLAGLATKILFLIVAINQGQPVLFVGAPSPPLPLVWLAFSIVASLPPPEMNVISCWLLPGPCREPDVLSLPPRYLWRRTEPATEIQWHKLHHRTCLCKPDLCDGPCCFQVRKCEIFFRLSAVSGRPIRRLPRDLPPLRLDLWSSIGDFVQTVLLDERNAWLGLSRPGRQRRGRWTRIKTCLERGRFPSSSPPLPWKSLANLFCFFFFS